MKACGDNLRKFIDTAGEMAEADEINLEAIEYKSPPPDEFTEEDIVTAIKNAMKILQEVSQ